jgi:hypothetical protein
MKRGEKGIKRLKFWLFVVLLKKICDEKEKL